MHESSSFTSNPMICSLLIGSEGRSNTHASVPKAPAVKDYHILYIAQQLPFFFVSFGKLSTVSSSLSRRDRCVRCEGCGKGKEGKKETKETTQRFLPFFPSFPSLSLGYGLYHDSQGRNGLVVKES